MNIAPSIVEPLIGLSNNLWVVGVSCRTGAHHVRPSSEASASPAQEICGACPCPPPQVASSRRALLGDGLVSPEMLIAFTTYHGLSSREIEVLAFTCQGLKRGQMSARLGISPQTVDTYCDSLHKKVGVKDRVALLRKLLGFAAGDEAY